MENKTKLFLALAAGRAICGMLVLHGVLLIAWIADNLGKTGLSYRELAGTIGMAILTALFANRAVVKYAAKVPYRIMVISSAAFMLDAIIIYCVGDICPYAVLVFGTMAAVTDKSYVMSRKVLFNRAYHGDELTLITAWLDLIGVAAAMGGAAAAAIIPATTTVMAIVIVTASAGLTISNYYQIKLLLTILGDDTEAFHAKVAALKAARREAILNGEE